MSFESPKDIASVWLDQYASATSSANVAATVSTFLPDGCLRDSLVFTWDSRSLTGTEKIAAYLSNALSRTEISQVKLDESPHFAPAFAHGPPGDGVAVAFTFETRLAHGRGAARLVKADAGEWKALVVLMMVQDLKGHEEMDHESGIYEGHTAAWTDVFAERRSRIEANPHVLIVGAGQTGLNIAARFKQMNIPSLVIDKNARVGDNWRVRYPTLTLHTPRTQHQMLYQPFPSTWPLFTPRDKLANWLELYAETQDVIVWTKTKLIPTPTYDAEKKHWNVPVDRDGMKVELHPTHVVLATGLLGAPRMPRLMDENIFSGETIHGSKYAGGKPYTGKRVIVVGACNTGIDICQDLVTHGAQSVTMVQRSSTCVVSGDRVADNLKRLWSEGVPVEVGDLAHMALPYGLWKKYNQNRQAELWAEEADLHEGLLKAGFKLNMGPEGQGQALLVFERGGGYWLDKGGAELIADGKIKIKQGVEPQRFTERGVVFTDGSEMPADVVMFATGYDNIRETNKYIFGADLINQTKEVYGLDDEGELEGNWRPSGHPALWYAAGDFYLSRVLSKQLALLIKATDLGLVQ